MTHASHALPLRLISRSAGPASFRANHVRARTAVVLSLGGLILTLAAAIGLTAPFVIDAYSTWSTEAATESAQPVTWGW